MGNIRVVFGQLKIWPKLHAKLSFYKQIYLFVDAICRESVVSAYRFIIYVILA